jgi:hypothetical protein
MCSLLVFQDLMSFRKRSRLQTPVLSHPTPPKKKKKNERKKEKT